jgi:hypothetical protein
VLFSARLVFPERLAWYVAANIECMHSCRAATHLSSSKRRGVDIYASRKREGAVAALSASYALRCVTSVGQSFATLHNHFSFLASRFSAPAVDEPWRALLKIGMSLEGIGDNGLWYQSF